MRASKIQVLWERFTRTGYRTRWRSFFDPKVITIFQGQYKDDGETLAQIWGCAIPKVPLAKVNRVAAF